jgi:Asp-tRNA(Asn)/Glu-tRNA(Gln) amidotransferase A subunit family amidase
MLHDNPMDPFAWRAPVADFLAAPPADPARLRVAFTADLGCVDVEPAIRQAFLAKIEKLEGRFAVLEEATPDLGDVMQAFWRLRPLKFMVNMGERYKADPRSLTEYKRTDMRRGYAISSEMLVKAMADQTRAFRAMAGFLQRYDLLLTPGWASGPLTLAEIARREAAMRAANDAVGPYEHDFSVADPTRAINPPVTLTHHPVLTLPAGLGPTGHPFAVNAVGRYRGDAALIAAGRALEALFDADEALRRPVPDLAAIARWAATRERPTLAKAG